MKKTIFIIIIIMTFNSFSYGVDKFDTIDYTLQGSYLFLLWVDWRQTIDFRSHGFEEANPFIKGRPSNNKVNIAVASVAISHTAISIFLPKKFRSVWQGFTLGTKIYTIRDNHKNGARVYFFGNKIHF